MIERGAGLIKVSVNGQRPNGEYYGIMGPGMLGAAVRTAHEDIFKVAAHCIGAEGALQAAKAGVDSIEPGIHLEGETVRMMAENGIFYVPTMSPFNMPDHLNGVSEVSAADQASRLGMRDSNQASFRRAMEAVKIATRTYAGGSQAGHGLIVREI